jgi:TetR/AcrR family transcriptional regulator
MQKQRARNEEDKAKRKQSIVDALHERLKESQSMPSAQDIAKRAGVTKGVIYIYFKTREEIFLTLFLQEAECFYEELYPLVLSDEYEILTLRDGITEFCHSHPVFMYLGLIAPSVLEHNVSEDFIRSFKTTAAEGLQQFATAWQKRESTVDVGNLRNFVLRIFYLGQILWQHHNPPPAVLSAVDIETNWLLQGNFKDSMSESFDWMWAGLSSVGSPAPS